MKLNCFTLKFFRDQLTNRKMKKKSPVAQLLTLDEAAVLLDVCSSTAANLAISKKLRSAKIGRRWRFRREDIDAFISGQFDK